jgi:hypothetical protein
MINRITWRLLKADPCYNNEWMNLNWPIGTLGKDNHGLALYTPPNTPQPSNMYFEPTWRLGFFESQLFCLPLDRLVALPEDKQVFFVCTPRLLLELLQKCWVSSWASLLSYDLSMEEMVSGSFLERIMLKTFLFLWYIMYELQTISYILRAIILYRLWNFTSEFLRE